ncbi:endo-1,3-alpha-glucanase family glycosylhydrolase [Methylocella silvestris]|uniref:endo-1,3-alpha-glucanase family glycosylhydrolase n=1 Tax=Methylocella silvestris TaxID=199596 RepID=UPI00059C3699|nr:endo-1,3-alpha-glucanase family glycosylhydrolase [Methylocella silvestris]
MKAEIVRMIARGINGVAVNLFSLCDWSESGANCPGNPGGGGMSGYPGTLINMLNAAAAVDRRFKVLPMPDMSAGIKPSDLPNLWKAKIGGTTIYNHPNLYRWPDANNYPELSPFCTECFPASQYSAAFATMKANGTPISWAPTFGSLGCNGQVNGCVFSPYASLPTVSINGIQGVSADRTMAALALRNVGGASGGKTYGGGTPINWTGPVKLFGGMSPQGYQSGGGTVYEAQNSAAYRGAWESQIALGASLGNIMIFTWNDFGESTAVEPSSNQFGAPSTGYYDLTGYYTTWWRKGAAPQITNDAIMYFYRRQTYLAAHNATIPGLKARPTIPSWNLPAYDNIEMVAFLKADATLSINIKGVSQTQAGKAGLNVFTIPLVNGTPVFSIIRGGAATLTTTGFPTYGSGQIPSQTVPGLTICSSCFPAGIPDPVYYSGSTFAWSAGVDYYGGDLRTTTIASEDPNLCEQSCKADSSCKSWSTRGRSCWLKSSIPLPSLNATVISGAIPTPAK